MKSWIPVTLTLALACGGAQVQTEDHAAGHPGAEHHPGHASHGMHHDFSDVERFAAIFDDPERDEWQRPDEVMTHLRLSAGAVVADLGAGTGYFEPHLCRAVGETGRVLALDVEPAMVEHMRARFDVAGLTNAEARAVAGDDPGLDAESVDRVLIVDTWHHIDDRAAYAARLRDALRPGGFVLIVDFTRDAPHGPPAAMRLTPETVIAELNAGGLHAELITDEALPYQYIVRASK